MLASSFALAEVVPVPPPEGATETLSRTLARDRYDVPVGRYGPDQAEAIRLEGRVARKAYRLDGGGASVAGVIDHYREGLVEQGFAPLFSCRGRDCGGFDFRFGVELLPAPAMLMDTANFAQLSMAAPDGHWASVLASRVMGAVYVQTVLIEGEAIGVEPPAPRPARPAVEEASDADTDRRAPIEAVIARRQEGPEPASGRPAGGPSEAATEETPSAPVDRQASGDEVAALSDVRSSGDETLAERLLRDGHAVLEGVAFDQGGAAFSSGSAAVLDRVAVALRGAATRLAVVGHSDATGALAPNIALSARRAEAVRAALIERGVAPDRLEAHGAGWLAPRSANDTEAGRARNRRVELIALP